NKVEHFLLERVHVAGPGGDLLRVVEVEADDGFVGVDCGGNFRVHGSSLVGVCIYSLYPTVYTAQPRQRNFSGRRSPGALDTHDPASFNRDMYAWSAPSSVACCHTLFFSSAVVASAMRAIQSCDGA